MPAMKNVGTWNLSSHIDLCPHMSDKYRFLYAYYKQYICCAKVNIKHQTLAVEKKCQQLNHCKLTSNIQFLFLFCLFVFSFFKLKMLFLFPPSSTKMFGIGSVFFIKCMYRTQGRYSYLDWSGMCCWKLKTHTHLIFRGNFSKNRYPYLGIFP